MKKITFRIATVFFAILLGLGQSAFAAIVINEVVVSGAQQLTDEDGENQDWVELYNTGGAKNLSGMYLSDDSGDFFKWPLPNTTLGSGQFLTIYCSGKNRNNPSANLHTNFGVSPGEPILLVDEDDGMLDEVAYNQTITIPADHSLGRLPDGTGAFIAFPIASPSIPNIDPSGSLKGIVINEIMGSNRTTLEFPAGSGLYPDWIELYNPFNVAVDVKGYTIYGDDNAWEFTETHIIPAGGYLIVYANDADIQSPPQTDFKIGSGGETITLEDQLGNVIDMVVCPAFSSDVSYGRFPNGGGSLELMPNPTPAAVNQSVTNPANPGAQYLRINEIVSSNKSTYSDYQGEYGDWIEIFNTSSSASVNVKNLVIGDSSSKWQFPDNDNIVIPPRGYLTVFADGKNSVINRGGSQYEAHTNFTISSAGEEITLYNTDWWTVEDTITIPGVPRDYSYGRYPDGSSTTREMVSPTPKAANEYSTIAPNINASNITINEICTNNISGIPDEDGDYSAWIELYNKGSITVDMTGLRLSDGVRNWAFTEGTTMTAGEYLVVFISGKNNTGGELHTNFTISAADGGTISLINKDNPNYTVIESVEIPILTEDTSLARLPNATVTLAISTYPTPGEANRDAPPTLNPNAQYIKINEVVTSNSNGIVDEDEDTGDWIELYNTSNSIAVNMEGLRIGDSGSQWIFPSVTIEPESYLLVWADSKDRTDDINYLHTNFNISSAGESIRLYNTDGTTVEDELIVPAIISDHSYGRYPDGTDTLREMWVTTPLAPNQYTVVNPNPDAANITINEVVTNNTAGLLDEDDELSGWIELYNKGTVAVDLVDLMLSDSIRVWQLPSVTMQPGQYLVIFASGKGRQGGELHTSFNFATDIPTDLLFLNKDASLIESVTVPVLSADESYSRIPNGTENFTISAVTTPGEANRTTFPTHNNNASLIVINEVMTSNQGGLEDENGDSPDWIELYNTSSNTSVHLDGLKLRSMPWTWVLPDITMEPNTYLIIFASGKDRTFGELHTNFTLSSNGDILQLENTDNTVLHKLVLPSLDSNTSYGRYPDGADTFEVMSYSTPGDANVSDSIPPNQNAQYIKINEVVTSNSNGIVDEDEDTGDWIELYNTSNSIAVNMEGLRIGDSGSQWIFPSVTIEPESYLLVWADGKDRAGNVNYLHANFNISSSGETITLYNTNGLTVEDEVVVPAIPSDHSYGRYPDGTENIKELWTTTPLAPNQDTVANPNPDAANITINEVVTNNTAGLLDEDDELSGWIELYNKGTVTVDLEGLRLSDSTRVWQLPSVALNAGQYIVIFASGKGRAGGELHTSFTLSTEVSTELLFLNKDNSLIESVTVPILSADGSYSRIPNGTENFTTSAVMTPGEANKTIAQAPNGEASLVVINEVMTSNQNSLEDEDGNSPDWIELYNTSNTTSVNLSGLKLRSMPWTWVLPNVTIEPNSYLIIFASAKDRSAIPGNLHTNFTLSANGAILQFENTNNAVLQRLVVPSLDGDTSYGKYRNGTGDFEVMTASTPGDENVSNSLPYNTNAALVTINEVSADWENTSLFADEDATAQDWIELYNTSPTISVNLEGCKIADSTNTWIFPNVSIGPNEYLILFASKKNRTFGELHTNFKLESGGEIVRFLNTDDTTIQELLVPSQLSNQSYGHYPNGVGSYQILGSSTPGTTNDINGSVLSVSLSTHAWAAGTIAPGSVITMTPGEKATVTNDGNVASKFALSLINPSGWTASTSASGNETYLLNAAFDADGTVVWSAANHAVSTIPVSSSATKFAGDQQGVGVQPGENRSLYLQFHAPTITAVASQQSVGLVITAEAE